MTWRCSCWRRRRADPPLILSFLFRGKVMCASLAAWCSNSYSLSLRERAGVRAGVRAPRSRFQGRALNLPTLTLALSRQREREKEADLCKLAHMPGRGESEESGEKNDSPDDPRTTPPPPGGRWGWGSPRQRQVLHQQVLTRVVPAERDVVNLANVHQLGARRRS